MAEEKRVLTAQELRELDDDQFFEAYKQGLAPRRKDGLTEENWEKVRVGCDDDYYCMCYCSGSFQ
jgi:hypothetical protein